MNSSSDQYTHLLTQALSLQKQGKLSEAIVIYKSLIALNPDQVAAWLNLGVAYRDQQLIASSLNCFKRALSLAPQQAGIMSNLAVLLKEQSRYSESIALHQQALHLEPHNVQFLTNYAATLCDSGEFAMAHIILMRVKGLTPNNHSVDWDIAHNLLAQNNYAEGFAAYEARWHLAEVTPPSFSMPIWLGKNHAAAIYHDRPCTQPLIEKTILLHAEQGFGDTIMAARFIKTVKQLVGPKGRVLLQCQPELHRLFKFIGADQLLTRVQVPGENGIPLADVHCPLMSLPGALDITPDTIPKPTRLTVNKHDIDRLSFINESNTTKMVKKIGIIWQGSNLFKKNYQRSLPLDAFLALAENPTLRLFSLQKGEALADLLNSGANAYITDLGSHCHDFADTAAAIHHLDGVIMTDSSVAHLAASLGKPIINLLHDQCYWIYRPYTKQKRTPWYANMHLAHHEDLYNGNINSLINTLF